MNSGFTTHQHANNHTKQKTFTPRTHHTRFILMLATCDVYRAHRHGSESPYPGSTPGLNPGATTSPGRRVDRGGHRDTTHTYSHVACGLWQHEGLMIHRSLWKSDDPKYRRHVHGIWIFPRGAGPRPHQLSVYLPVTRCGKMATLLSAIPDGAGASRIHAFYGRLLHSATLNNSTAYAPLGLACLCLISRTVNP